MKTLTILFWLISGVISNIFAQYNFSNLYNVNDTLKISFNTPNSIKKYDDSNLVADKNIIYLSPTPGSQNNYPATNIILGYKNKVKSNLVLKPGFITVTGSQSGNHEGKLIITEQNKKVLFNPYKPFKFGEKVNVHIKLSTDNTLSSVNNGYDFNFYIKLQKSSKNISSDFRINLNKTKEYKKTGDISLKNTSLPSIYLPTDFPVISAKPSSPDSGYYLISNVSSGYADPYNKFIMILDNNAIPQFYQRVDNNADGFTLQPNGKYTFGDQLNAFYVIMDLSLKKIDTIYCQNGFATDIHEMRYLPNGNILLIGNDIVTVDMTQYGIEATSSADVIDMVIQELDTSRNVVFQWRSLDYFKVIDAAQDINLTSYLIDYAHTNAIEIDTDSNLIISNRNMDEITKINHLTGEIIWRWGGKNNQFKFINDTIGFSHQHAIRRLPNGNFIMLDNGNLHPDNIPSRALEYKLDQTKKTAELVWQYFHNPPIYSKEMGYVQCLNNGNRVICWGDGSPGVTEINSKNEVVNEITLPSNQFTYRAYKFDLGLNFKSLFVNNLNAPYNKSNVNSDSVNLVWNSGRFSLNYQLQVALDSNFQNIYLEDSNVSDTNYILFSLAPNTTYYWHVLSNNNNDTVGGLTSYSDTWSFKTRNNTTSNVNNDINTINLLQNYPNPVSFSTVIQYSVTQPSFIKLELYDDLGLKIGTLLNEYKDTGIYELTYNTNDLAPGIYFYTLKAGVSTLSNKMIILR